MSTDRSTDDSFFGSLFDFSFTSFITTKLIKVLYVLAIIAIGFWAVALIIAGFSQGGGAGILSIFGAVIGFLLGIIYVRVLLELVIVIFRIGEHTESMASSLAGGLPPAAPWQSPGAPPAQPYRAPEPGPTPGAPPTPPPSTPAPGWQPPPAPSAGAEDPTRRLPDDDEDRGPGNVPPPPA